MAIDLPGHGASTLPLGDLYGDAQHVVDVLGILARPVVLVGHSYGGAVITEAAVSSPHVQHLVYLTAFALDEGESAIGALGAMPRHEVELSAAMRMCDDGTSVLDPDLAAGALYGSCSSAVATAALARLSPQPIAPFGQPVTGAPRNSIPSTYVLCTLDRAIHPEHQRIMSARCTNVVTLETDHSPFASATDETADVIASTVASTVASMSASNRPVA